MCRNLNRTRSSWCETDGAGGRSWCETEQGRVGVRQNKVELV